MIPRLTGLLVLLGVVAGTPMPALAQGQCVNCVLPPGCRGVGNGKKNDPRCVPLPALDLTVESNIDFGRLLLVGSGNGYAVIDLTTGSRTLFGELDDLGGMPVAGQATITGGPRASVRVDLPASVTLVDATGASAELRDFRTSLPLIATLGADGRLTFRFTGTLYTTARAAGAGRLRGRVPLRVAYE